MRTQIFDLPYREVIPFSVAAAIIGQVIGKKLALFGHRQEAEPASDAVSALTKTDVGTKVEGS